MKIRTSTALLPLALLVLLPGTAWSQDPAAATACDLQKGALVIRYTANLFGAVPPWPAEPAPLRFMTLLDVGQDDASIVEGTRSTKVSCQLRADRFEITLAPGVPNKNLTGPCGRAVTGLVSVTRNGTLVLENQSFEDLKCESRTRTLVAITFTDGSPSPALEYLPRTP